MITGEGIVDMKNFFDENLSLADFKNRIEKSIRNDNRRFIGIIVIVSVMVAALVTLLVLKLVRAKRMKDWLNDDFYDDFDDDDFDDDFDIEIKKDKSETME